MVVWAVGAEAGAAALVAGFFSDFSTFSGFAAFLVAGFFSALAGTVAFVATFWAAGFLAGAFAGAAF